MLPGAAPSSRGEEDAAAADGKAADSKAAAPKAKVAAAAEDKNLTGVEERTKGAVDRKARENPVHIPLSPVKTRTYHPPPSAI